MTNVRTLNLVKAKGCEQQGLTFSSNRRSVVLLHPQKVQGKILDLSHSLRQRLLCNGRERKDGKETFWAQIRVAVFCFVGRALLENLTFKRLPS